MIYLFTDFGWHGPYVGQMKAVIQQQYPQIPIIDLMHDAPVFNPQHSSVLLHALSSRFNQGDIVLAVVDPGVGNAQRRPIILQADGIHYVGPDNGLFDRIAKASRYYQFHEIIWRPEAVSSTFHGRDLFAPIVNRLLSQESLEQYASRMQKHITGVAECHAEIIYIDHYGNCMTGIAEGQIDRAQVITLNNRNFVYQRTFSEVASGQTFWTINSLGLVELAMNQGNLACQAGISLGMFIEVAKK